MKGHAIVRSIRGRLLLWLAFLLVLLLGGFGLTSFQLNRLHRFAQIDTELEQRVAAVSNDRRAAFPPPHPPPGFRPPGADRPGGKEPKRGERDRWEPEDHGPPNIDPPATPPDGPGSPGEAFPPRKGFGGPDRRFTPDQVREFLTRVELSARTLGMFDETDTNGFYYGVWAPDGSLLKSSTNVPPGLAPPARLGRDTALQRRTRGELREAYHFTEMGDCILAGRSITADLAAIKRFGLLLAGVGLGVLAVGLGGGWVLANGALRPVEKISATANRIALGNLAERIDVSETESELGRLASVLNSTFSRLESAFAQQRQFTADASHELRTPLAVIISETQSALTRQRSPAEYQETLQACLEAAQQMRRLTHSLLQLARFDAGQQPLEHTQFDLAATAASCLELVRPLAEHRGVSLESELNPAPLVGDPDRLGQVITNLLANAIQYSLDRGRVRLETGAREGTVRLAVTDDGPGIAPEHLPRIFERFYRADKSRARAEGHAGLGLAISKAIVEAHGGSISVSSKPGAGASFEVILLAAAPSRQD